MHPALDERAPDVDLVPDLSVRVVQPFVEPRRQEVVEKRARVAIDLGETPAPGVATGAGPDLGLRHTGREVDAQAGRRGRRRLLFRGGARPVDVRGAGTVAGLASDVDRGPGGAVRIALHVVVRAQVGRVALRAHHVPALVAAGPVQRIVRRDRLVRIEVEPLAALRVPRDRQALEVAAGKRRQVLLERLDTEGVGQLEVGELPVRTLRVDEEPPVTREEAGGQPKWMV